MTTTDRSGGNTSDGSPPSRLQDEDVTAGELVDALRYQVEALESDDRVDGLVGVVGRIAAPFGQGRNGEVLRGEWLGHALHPIATDIPLGCFIGAGLIDLVMGRRGAGAAEMLVGLGVMAAVPTAAAGLAEWPTLTGTGQRRITAVHAAGNGGVALCYAASWLLRRTGRYRSGVAVSLVGAGLAGATGYLGGHLSFARAAGQGERWSIGRRSP